MQMQSKLCKREGDGVSLPEDILFDVLLRLPTKSLRRFRCVCKGWLALISGPAFVAARRSRSGASAFIVAAFAGSAPSSELKLRLLDTDGNVLRVFDDIGSGSGTAALLAPTRLDMLFVDRMRLGAMIIDPTASGGVDSFTVVGTEIDDPAHAPLNWWWWTGHESPSSTALTVNDYSFGRATSQSGDGGCYKVLRLHVTVTSSQWNGPHQRRRCEVATIMKEGGVASAVAIAEPTWRTRPWGPFSESSFSYEHKATVDGHLYFMWASHDRHCVAAFNLESEEWKRKAIKGPLFGRMNEEDKWRITLTELKGALCMVHNVQHLTVLGGHYANVWLLKDADRSIWVKKYKIQMHDRLSLFTKPLDVLIDGTLLLLTALQKAGNNGNCHRYVLRYYNSSTKSIADFMEMEEGFNGRMAFYTGSLQS